MLFTKDYSKLLLIPEGKEGAASVPDQSTLVSATAFSRCSVLSQILVGDSATYTSYDGVLYSKDLKTLVACPAGIGASIVIPSETEAIDKDALSGCKDLASITALGNVQKIDPTAFSDETKATAVVALPAGQDYNARKATWEQAGFQHFAEPAKPGATTNPDTNEATSGLTYTLLDDYTLSVSWQGKDDPEANLDIPASAEINGVPYRVSTIAENAFANRGSLTSVKLPTTITAINNGAFAACANLATIEFPNTLRTIGERAFEATSIKDIWLPASINSIGSRAFASCSSLERVVALGTPEVASDAIAGCTNVSIYVSTGSEDTWNPGLPSDNNHLMPYGISLSEEPLTIEAGQEADLLDGGNLQVPDPIEASYSYAAAPLSVDAGQVSAKKAGTSDVTAVLTLDDVELARASRTVEVSPNPEAEANITQLSSEVALPGVYLASARALQISVSAPTQVVLGEASGYDVATKPASATGTVVFKNNSTNLPVQLSSVTCATTAAESYIETKDNSKPLETQKIFSLYPQGNDGAAVSFGYGAGVNTVTSFDKSAFLIDSNSVAPFTFRLNLTNDTTNLANAMVKEKFADNGVIVRPLATVTCTFEIANIFKPVPNGSGTIGANFYLKDSSTGYVYSLAEVKSHAKDISENEENSKYYNMYADYATDDSKYECRSKWTSGTYDLRIIDVLHDDKASGGKAGLTFQLKNPLNGIYKMNFTSTSAGGWGQSWLRARMNPDDLSSTKDVIDGTEDDNAIWSQAPIDLQGSIEVVKKKYQPDRNGSTSVKTSNDKLFLASYSELVETSYWGSTHWTVQEGTQYAYWYKKVTRNSGSNPALAKSASWWERSVHPGSSVSFFMVKANGDPIDINNANFSSSVCPCFCL